MLRSIYIYLLVGLGCSNCFAAAPKVPDLQPTGSKTLRTRVSEWWTRQKQKVTTVLDYLFPFYRRLDPCSKLLLKRTMRGLLLVWAAYDAVQLVKYMQHIAQDSDLHPQKEDRKVLFLQATRWILLLAALIFAIFLFLRKAKEKQSLRRQL